MIGEGRGKMEEAERRRLEEEGRRLDGSHLYPALSLFPLQSFPDRPFHFFIGKGVEWEKINCKRMCMKV